MSQWYTSNWTRRTWLARQVFTAAGFCTRMPASWRRSAVGESQYRFGTSSDKRTTRHTTPLDPTHWQLLAQQAMDAARTAGAHYADVRLTRITLHNYNMSNLGRFSEDYETVGIGVRALINGYWGFSSSAVVTSDEVVRLAQAAVAAGKQNAKGLPRIVEFGTISVARGTWATPLRIDPFDISIEEKLDFIAYWKQCAEKAGVDLNQDGGTSWLKFVRQERVVATSEGALFTQTLYESAGLIDCIFQDNQGKILAQVPVSGIGRVGAGWELFLDAHIPDQYPKILEELHRNVEINKRSEPITVGRYTLVCDGATMAALVEATIGVATQLDRALGYEANARGTSFIDDPLAMVGNLPVASPVVTVTGNRSAPGALATVRWDDEGVEPQPFTLIKDGVLVDFQTTREQAAWLASYYQQRGQPVRSHGCAAAEDAHVITLQHMPNLSLEPSPSPIHIEDLVADVKDGIFVEAGTVVESDSQARTGLLVPGRMREIKGGRLKQCKTQGVVLFNTKDLWRHIPVIGGSSTQGGIGCTQYTGTQGAEVIERVVTEMTKGKGQPSQMTSHSISAPAATIPDQPVINPARKV